MSTFKGKADLTFASHMSAFDPKRTSRGQITAQCPPSSVLGYADTMPRLEPRGEAK